MTETNGPPQRRTLWLQALNMAKQTPPERNRYVDFLRAFSILAVVIGHWLVAAPFMKDGAIAGGHLLGILPWTQWLTLGFQVMPVFFLVGGFSNGISWAAHQRKGGSWPKWFGARVQRLISPVLPLFLIWASVALFGTAAGIERGIVKMAAQLALIPVWFLAVYMIVTALVPWSYAAWRRWGFDSFWPLVAGAAVIDVATLQFRIPHVNMLNFMFVWLAVHQLGYAWQADKFSRPAHAIVWGTGGILVLALLIWFGPYPVAMIGVPGAELSNSMPPTLALLALGVAQTGTALALEPQARRFLNNVRAWAAVVLLNGMIMTVYLWHLTAFVLVMIAAWSLGGVGLNTAPGSESWWLARPIWFALYVAALLPLILFFSRYERAGRGTITPVGHGRLIAGLLLICAGLGASAAISIASPLGVTGVRLWVVALPFAGAALAGLGSVRGTQRQG
jgi:peptidoglycan/LPS O-acetylase OafA/YrhL